MAPEWMQWHQRFPIVRGVRAWARGRFFDAVHAAARTHEGRAIITEALDGLTSWRPTMIPASVRTNHPYSDVGSARPNRIVAGNRGAVFVTARFRSGSTLLWLLFRNVDGCTAYYEPLNERRWFDPTRRGTKIDATHTNVDDYWREYDGLEELGKVFNDSWTDHRLYMDEADWDPRMAAYVQGLIQHAPRRPVLQFNRIDFRLPWFRQTFPDATIVHLYRHPRDQWCSSLSDWDACSTSCSMDDFRIRDAFYLFAWAHDLKYHFPFLEPRTAAHPYRIFYFLWKLSYLVGVSYADYSLAFESLLANPEVELTRLFDRIDVKGYDLRRLAALVVPPQSRWRRYASDDWFREHEEACERVLIEFFQTNATLELSSATGPRKRRTDPS